jgi:hypothetical protein
VLGLFDPCISRKEQRLDIMADLLAHYRIKVIDGTINDCHTSGRFDPPFSWEMPVPSREYEIVVF